MLLFIVRRRKVFEKMASVGIGKVLSGVGESENSLIDCFKGSKLKMTLAPAK